jgi:pyruvate kinase
MTALQKKTKIICTLGPASNRKSTIRKMVEAGMNGARINISHGSFEDYKKMIKRVRSIAPIPIIVDTAGPEIRFKTNTPTELNAGDRLTVGFEKHAVHRFDVDFLEKAKPGTRILMADGTMELKVVLRDMKNRTVTLKALTEGTLKDGMHVNLRGVSMEMPVLSERDRRALKLASRLELEFIALSFVRSRQDVIEAKELLEEAPTGIIAKIENSAGVENFDEIIEEADGAMVARGDLGVEMPMEKVPVIQKRIVQQCNQHAKISIVATQMLASMVKHPRPTRAEASDVANAILDGADCVMLSDETAVGKYPVKAVHTMSKIAEQAESYVRHHVEVSKLSGISDAIAKSIYNMSKHLPVDKVVVVTHSGYTARNISRFKIKQPIIALTENEAVRRKLMLVYNVIPFTVKRLREDSRTIDAARYCLRHKLITKGELVIFTAGVFVSGEASNLIELHKTEDLIEFVRKRKRR